MVGRNVCERSDVIDFMHDKYSYERIEMALHFKKPTHHDVRYCPALRDRGQPVSHSLSLMFVVRDECGLAVDFEIEGDFPQFGKYDSRVDELAVSLVTMFMGMMRAFPDGP